MNIYTKAIIGTLAATTVIAAGTLIIRAKTREARIRKSISDIEKGSDLFEELSRREAERNKK